MTDINEHLTKNAHDTIINIISSFHQNKTLVIDKILEKLINIAMKNKMSELKKYGVKQMVFLDVESFEPIENVIVYFVLTTYESMNIINDNMKKFPKHEHNIYFSPTRSLPIEHILEFHGIPPKYMFQNLVGINLLPIDLNILSMEIPMQHINKFVTNNVKTIIHYIAQIIQNFGYIPRIHGIGPCAQYIANILLKHKYDNGNGLFDKIIIIDRQCDLLTPLLSQESYRGIISELCNEEFKKILPFSDIIYEELHNKEFADVGTILHEKIKLKTDIEKKYKLMQMDNASDINEMKKMYNELHDVPKNLLTLHINIVEKCIDICKNRFAKFTEIEANILDKINQNDIDKYIDNLIDNRESVITIIRLLSLISLTGKLTDYENYKKKIISKFGCKYVFIFEDLHKFGFFKTNFMGGIFDDYIGITTTINRFMQNKKIKTTLAGSEAFYFNNKTYTKTNNTLILVVGGITYDEIDDLAKCKKQINGNVYIATTSIINGNNLIESFIPV